MPTYETTYCINHPKTETKLRCNRCEEYICASCSVHTPTGYRCKDCIKEHEKVFNTSLWYDYLIGFIVAAILAAIGSAIVSLLSNWFFGLFVLLFSPFAATIIVNAVQAATRRRRSKSLFITIALGVLAGGLPAILGGISSLLFIFSSPEYASNFSIWWILPLIWQVVYLFITAPAVYANLSGFTFK
ncbi:MAG: hypothetical protein GY755_13955 [Chloroflexi bacterium]|nr:hypothetical protein [Chloroflexota bacterium]